MVRIDLSEVTRMVLVDGSFCLLVLYEDVQANVQLTDDGALHPPSRDHQGVYGSFLRNRP